MATEQELRTVLRDAVDFAIESVPDDLGMRHRMFAAYLARRLELLGDDMAADVDRLRFPNGRPAAGCDQDVAGGKTVMPGQAL